MFSLQSVVRLSLSSSLGLALLLLLTLIYSSPLQNRPQLVIQRLLERIPDGYVQTGKANSSQTITLTIGLHSPNVTGLKQRLYEVSMPNSTLYGQHLTKEEAETHVRPHANTTNTLRQWLATNGLASKKSSSAGNYVKVELTIEKAQNLLNTTFYVYNHLSSNQSIIRTDQYSVPESMNDTIRFISPTTHFPSNPKSPRGRPGVTSAVPPLNTTSDINRRDECDFTQITVGCILSFYGIPTNLGIPSNNDRAAVIEIAQSVQGRELALFLGHFRPDVKLATIDLDIMSVGQADNIQSETGENLEANLDFQMLLGVMPSAKVTAVAAGRHDEPDMDTLDVIDATLDAIDAILAMETIPSVFSVSYEIDESDISQEMAHSVCEAFIQYGNRGGTAIVASGVGGVSGAHSQSCTKFVPTFPATCPFVLSVGATDLSSGTEVAEDFSSGGFSNYFPRENYQDNAVKGYLNQIGDQNAGLYNSSGRGFPDMSIIGKNIIVLDQGEEKLVEGSSISTAVISGLIFGLNQLRRTQGKGLLGFVNPALYSATDSFKDITQGSNPGCDTNGFPAKSGWDPVTGLGSPIFDKLKDL